jgi:hypothetical protein
MNTLKAIWKTWKRIAHTIADFQARVLLSVFYFVILGPFAVGAKRFSDPLRLGRGAAAGWLPRPDVVSDPLTRARRQF